MKTIVYLSVFSLLTGCVCLDPDHHQNIPPKVQTEKVIESLKKIRTNLDEAGDENVTIDQKLTRALTLAEKLDILLEQLETMFNAGKTTVKPL